jgi:hypothetical protein
MQFGLWNFVTHCFHYIDINVESQGWPLESLFLSIRTNRQKNRPDVRPVTGLRLEAPIRLRLHLIKIVCCILAEDKLDECCLLPILPPPSLLVPGVRDEAEERTARSAFSRFPTFKNELPFAPLFQEQGKKGRLYI